MFVKATSTSLTKHRNSNVYLFLPKHDRNSDLKLEKSSSKPFIPENKYITWRDHIDDCIFIVSFIARPIYYFKVLFTVL